MKLFGAKVHWYDSYRNKEAEDYVMGFAHSLDAFTAHLVGTFEYIQSVELEVINDTASDNQLLYFDPNDLTTIVSVQKENSY